MNAARLAEIEALANAATPGPWGKGEDFKCEPHEVVGPGNWITETEAGDTYDWYDGPVVAACASHFGEDIEPFWDANRDFIAEARTAVPDLATALREARELADIWHATALRFGRQLGPMALGPAADADLESASAAFDAAKEAW